MVTIDYGDRERVLLKQKVAELTIETVKLNAIIGTLLATIDDEKEDDDGVDKPENVDCG